VIILIKLREFQDKGIGAIKPHAADSNQEETAVVPSTALSNGPATNSTPTDLAKITRRQGSSSMEVTAWESLNIVRSMGKAVERNISQLHQS
jgi:hypothetical protein